MTLFVKRRIKDDYKISDYDSRLFLSLQLVAKLDILLIV